ncbi:NAD-dependent epimerase/dehydratase family protein, partial [Singulisphaera rosea]
MKWVVTGGAGFIGATAASRFLAQGDTVILVDNLKRRASRENLEWLRGQGGDLTTYEADVRNLYAMNSIIGQHADADVILHLAAQDLVSRSLLDPMADFETNAVGTMHILESIRKHANGRPALIYASTNKVYGDLESLDLVVRDGRYAFATAHGVDEEQPLDFHCPYGCSKGAADQYVRDYARMYGLRTVVFRQSSIYGPRQVGTEGRGWVSWFGTAAVDG